MERAKASVEEVKKRVADLANVFLPDGLNPFVDVFVRVRARREMRSLIDEAAIEWRRHTPGQLIEMLFYGDGPACAVVAQGGLNVPSVLHNRRPLRNPGCF